jgi:hypothetical protein
MWRTSFFVIVKLPAAGGVARVLGAQAEILPLPGLQIQVRLQFPFKIPLAPLARSPEHYPSSAGHMMRAMAPVSFFHFDSSAVS